MTEEFRPEDSAPAAEPPYASDASQQQAPPVPSRDDRNMGMLCHLLALFSHIIGPLIIWLIKKEDSKYVDYHGIQVLNFQLTMMIVYFLCIPLIFLFIGIALLPVAVLVNIIFTIMGAVAAQNGEYYKYPFSFKFLS